MLAEPWVTPSGSIPLRPELSARTSLRQFPRCFAGKYGFGERPPVRLGVTTHGNHLRCHGNRDLLGRNCADLQAHGRMDALHALARDALFFKLLDDIEYLALAADHGDITRLCAHGPAQHAHIVAVPARHDDDVTRLIDGQ